MFCDKRLVSGSGSSGLFQTGHSGRDTVSYTHLKEQIIAASDVMLGVWEGLGKNAFQDAYRILKVELQDEEESLNVIYDDLKAIKESYEEWDTSVSEGLQQA